MPGKFSWLILFLFIVQNISAQKMGFKSTTRAVVVGISDYQDESIPDLKYAHNDAKAFVDYLKSDAGGRLKDEQIVSLINEKATIAQIYAALDWLIDESKNGDQVIIYLSGHGDVETKTIRQRGYYLAYDSPANNYRIGAVRLEDLNDVIATISQSNNSKVIMISDACRSGKLAGNGVDGTQVTASAFSTQYAKELRILSCQPNEFSLEGKQWGGGRGVFSYHLIDGLVGLADGNKDEMVNLREVERYLEDVVAKEVMPQHQNPMVVGNKLELISFVDQQALATLQQKKEQENIQFGMVGTRELESENLTKADSAVAELYAQFNLALEEKYFLPRDTNAQTIAGQSASELYDQLIQEPSLSSVHNLMKRNFAAALQDVAQQSLNAYLRADIKELYKRWLTYGKSYAANPDYLSKAADLLGPDHYIYEQLLVKKYYFEGVIKRLEAQKTKQNDLLNLAFNKVDTALNYDDQAAYVHNELGLIAVARKQTDDAIQHYISAMLLAPTWVLPVSNMFTVYKMKRRDSIAVEWANRAIDLDSTYSQPYYNLGYIYDKKGNSEEAKKMYLKTIYYNEFHAKAHSNLGLLYFEEDSLLLANTHFKKSVSINPDSYIAQYNTGESYLFLDNIDSAKVHFEKAYELNPDDIDIVNLRGVVFLENGEFELAETWLLQAYNMDTSYVYPRLDLVDLYLITDDLEKANAAIAKLQDSHPNNETLYFYQARLSLKNGNIDQALAQLEVAFEKGFSEKRMLEDESDFDAIRNNQAFLDLVEEYLGGE